MAGLTPRDLGPVDMAVGLTVAAILLFGLPRFLPQVGAAIGESTTALLSGALAVFAMQVSLWVRKRGQ